LSREGSLSCHTYCDTGPRFIRSHPKDRPIQSPLTTRMGMQRIYSNPDPHGGTPNGNIKCKDAYRIQTVRCACGDKDCVCSADIRDEARMQSALSIKQKVVIHVCYISLITPRMMMSVHHDRPIHTEIQMIFVPFLHQITVVH
jgi:hypothetical protein